jgi:hypothetical protein
MAITQDQLEALSKQVFITDYLLNGLFPCQSDIVRLIRSKKREWRFNDKFEYRMLLANTNTGGSLNSQVFKETVGLRKPGELEYGTYHATYGSVSDGFDVDMMVNLETREKKAAFETDYASRMHSLRNNVAALFKNFAIHGRFGVVHQIRASIDKPSTGASRNPVANVHQPTIGTPFTIKTPINVFNSNFKRGKLLIKTTEATPWGAANVAELYLVLDNQPGELSLLPCGTAVSRWEDGQFLEVAQNREIVGMPADTFGNWNESALTVNSGPFQGVYDQFTGSGAYTSGANAVTGAMEGIADLFPWYTNPADMETRLGLDLPYRGQANRLRYSTEQAGGFILQKDGEHIIDAIMRGAFLTKATVPYADIGIWMNPVTRVALGYEEGNSVQVLRDNFVEGAIVYQRGVKSTDYQIGNQVVKEVVEDLNMPTDVIIIGPKNDLSYNCWDNATFEIDNYIHETFGKSAPPKIQDLPIPDELLAKMDLSQRITFGAPTLRDGRLASFDNGNNIRHPKNVVPVAMHEMGALFTEYPFTYTVVKLREPITDLQTV